MPFPILEEFKRWYASHKFTADIANPESISAPIVEAIQGKDYPTFVTLSNPDEVQSEVTFAISQLEQTLKEELSKLDKEVVVKNDLSSLLGLFKTNHDKKDVIAALEKVQKAIQSIKFPEQKPIVIPPFPKIPDFPTIPEPKDYTQQLQTLINELRGKDNQSGVIERLEALVSILERFQRIKISKFLNNDRIKVEVDRVGSHAWTEYITNKSGNRINPATDEKLDAIVTAVQANSPAAQPSVVRNNQRTVTTAGTRVQLSVSSVSVQGVIIQALSTNTGSVWVGDSTVSASNGFELQPGQATSVAIDDLSKVYIDASTNGDKVCFLGS